MANDTRVKLAKKKFLFHRQKIGFTISGGVAEFGKAKNFEKLFCCADKALYKAKKKGKNRIIKYTDL